MLSTRPCRRPPRAGEWSGDKRPVDKVRKGDEVDDLHNPSVGPPKGNASADRARDAAVRDSFFVALANRHPDLAAVVLARTRDLP